MTRETESGATRLELARSLQRRIARRTTPAPTCADGAVVATADGRSSSGVTFHADTPGLAVCAVRTALARARAESDAPVTALTLVWLGAHRETCGLCRQMIVELAPDADVQSLDEDTLVPADSLVDLPDPFTSFRPGRST